MEQQAHVENKNSDFLAFLVDEEVNIDDVEFKPLNQGLGFHQEGKDRVYHPIKKATPRSLTNTKTDRTAKSDLGIANLDNTNKINEISLKGQELAAIYQSDMQSEMTKRQKKKTLKKALVKDATMSSIFVAWFIDMILVASLVGATAGMFVYLSGYSLDLLLKKIPSHELGVFFGAIFVIYYMAYFSILDIVQSPGKAGMKIRLIRTNGQGVKINDTLARAFITLLSLPLIGMPCAIDFQGKLSDTKVIQDV